MYNILIVDDTEINLMMIERLLTDMPVSVEKATGGEAALSILQGKTFDFCLFDYQMPKMSGAELLKAMRELGAEYKDIPVIAMTGTEDENAREFFLDIGFDSFIEKPIKKEELLNLLFDITNDPTFDEGGFVVTDDELKKIPEGLLEIEELDIRTGMKNAGSVEDYLSAIKIFCRAIDETANEIEKAYADDDIKTYTIKVHGLKSTARMVGAFGVSDMAAHLEEASKTVGHANLSTDTGQLLSVYRGIHQKIRNAMTECQKDAATDKRIADAYATISDYAELEEYDLIELVIGAMDHYEMPADHASRFKRIKESLMNFDFGEIRAIIKEVE